MDRHYKWPYTPSWSKKLRERDVETHYKWPYTPSSSEELREGDGKTL